MVYADELEIQRFRVIEFFKKEGMDVENRITCDKCIDLFDCEYAYDMYNIDGDCLASK